MVRQAAVKHMLGLRRSAAAPAVVRVFVRKRQLRGEGGEEEEHQAGEIEAEIVKKCQKGDCKPEERGCRLACAGREQEERMQREEPILGEEHPREGVRRQKIERKGQDGKEKKARGREGMGYFEERKGWL